MRSRVLHFCLCPDSTLLMIWVISAERRARLLPRGQERDRGGGTKDTERRWEWPASQGIFPSLHFTPGLPSPPAPTLAPLRATRESISKQHKSNRELGFLPNAAQQRVPRCCPVLSQKKQAWGGEGVGWGDKRPKAGAWGLSWLFSDDFLPRSPVLTSPGRQMARCQASLSLDPGSAISQLCDLGAEI